jgi:hypothetical protein
MRQGGRKVPDTLWYHFEMIYTEMIVRTGGARAVSAVLEGLRHLSTGWPRCRHLYRVAFSGCGLEVLLLEGFCTAFTPFALL